MEDNDKSKKVGTLNIVLSQKDGWNFGLGFMTAVFVFSFILIPLLACSIFAAIALVPQLL